MTNLKLKSWRSCYYTITRACIRNTRHGYTYREPSLYLEPAATRGGSRISHWEGGANPHWRGCQPLTQALFSENICKNERIWSCWGGVHQKLLYVDPPLATQGAATTSGKKLHAQHVGLHTS